MSEVVLLDFNGFSIAPSSPWAEDFGSGWQAGVSITPLQQQQITNRLTNDWRLFGVVFTTDEQVDYDQRVVFLPEQEWTTPIPSKGLALYNTFGRTDEPCFVRDYGKNKWETETRYAKLLAETASHELGHTIGLTHEAHNHLTVMKTELRRDVVVWNQDAVRLAADNGLTPRDIVTGMPAVIV
jgi:hypothetical protein